MSKWLAPKDVQTYLHIGRTNAYKLFREYVKSGRECFRQGRVVRIKQEDFDKFLKGKR